MNSDNPIHKLKKIKPKIYLFRDAAILDLFKELYKIIGEFVEIDEYKDKQFLLIPISGKHLVGPTAEHFFLKGAPMGIFNFSDRNTVLDAISGILTYSLFNRHVGFSATKTINSLNVGCGENNIISYGSVKVTNETPIFSKNYKPYSEKVLGDEKFIDDDLWNRIFRQVKENVNCTYDDGRIFEMPDLYKTLQSQFAFNKPDNDIFYIAENILALSKNGKLNYNYYFPSLHFEENENSQDHSYGFMVISTAKDINANEQSNLLLEFFERLSLVTFSLVGIIEQHHYVKVERHKPIIEDIKHNPLNILKLDEKIKKNEVEKEILVDFGRSELIKSIWYCQKSIMKSDTEKVTQLNTIKSNLFGEEEENILGAITTTLRDELIRFYGAIEYKTNNIRFAHVVQSITGNHLTWENYKNTLESFSSLKVIDEEIFNTYFQPLFDALKSQNAQTLTSKIEEWEANFSKVIIRDSTKFLALKSKKVFIEHKDWETINNIINENYHKYSTDTSKIDKIAPEFNKDCESYVEFYFKTQDAPLDEIKKMAVSTSANSVVDKDSLNRLPGLKYLVCQKYSGCLEFINYENGKKWVLSFKNSIEESQWEEVEIIPPPQKCGFYYKLKFE